MKYIDITSEYTVKKKYQIKKQKYFINDGIRYNILGKQRRQADNFIFDISNREINKEEAIRQIRSIYNSDHRKWVQKLILIENNKILKIYKRG